MNDEEFKQFLLDILRNEINELSPKEEIVKAYNDAVIAWNEKAAELNRLAGGYPVALKWCTITHLKNFTPRLEYITKLARRRANTIELQHEIDTYDEWKDEYFRGIGREVPEPITSPDDPRCENNDCI